MSRRDRSVRSVPLDERTPGMHGRLWRLAPSEFDMLDRLEREPSGVAGLSDLRPMCGTDDAVNRRMFRLVKLGLVDRVGGSSDVCWRITTLGINEFGHALRWLDGERPPVELPESFWKRVDKTDGCWVWRGGAHVCYRGERMSARQWAWRHVKQTPPGRYRLVAKCGNHSCIHPDHATRARRKSK